MVYIIYTCACAGLNLFCFGHPAGSSLYFSCVEPCLLIRDMLKPFLLALEPAHPKWWFSFQRQALLEHLTFSWALGPRKQSLGLVSASVH